LYKKALCHELDHLEGVLFTDIAEQVFSASEPFEDEDDDLDFEDEKTRNSDADCLHGHAGFRGSAAESNLRSRT
jgi:hypothetical protein